MLAGIQIHHISLRIGGGIYNLPKLQKEISETFPIVKSKKLLLRSIEQQIA